MNEQSPKNSSTPSLTATVLEAMEAMVQDFDYIDLASSLVSSTIELLGANAAGVMIGDSSQLLHVVAASDEDMRTLEVFEIQNDEGPCLDSWYSGRMVTCDDLATDERWGAFRARATELGFRSALADLAALGLTSKAVPSEATFLAEQIHRTINARVTIEQAKGMLAEQDNSDMNTAYTLMRNYSKASDTHLVATAELVTRRKITAATMRAAVVR